MTEPREKLTHAMQDGQPRLVVRTNKAKFVDLLLSRFDDPPGPDDVRDMLKRLRKAGARFTVAGYVAAERDDVLIDKAGFVCGQPARGDFIVPLGSVEIVQ